MMPPATDLSAGVAVDVVEETNQGQQGWGGIGAVLLLVMVDGRQCNDISWISFLITFPPPESLFRFEVMKPRVRSMTERIRSTMWKNRQIILKTILQRVTSRERIKLN